MTFYATDSLIGRMFIDTLIPIISRFQQDYPLKMCTMFSPKMLQRLNLQADLNLGDIQASDRYFTSIPSK